MTYDASMGPPIFIGGNAAAGRPGQTKQTCFMGPPIFIGGNDANALELCNEREELQWGRRFSSAEIGLSVKAPV